MKRGKLDSLSRLGSIQVLVIILFLYPISTTFGSEVDESTTQSHTVKIDNNNEDENSLHKQAEKRARNGHKKKEFNWVSGLVFNEIAFDSIDKIEFSELHRAARDAFVIGRKVFEEIRSGNAVNNFSSYSEDKIRVNEKKDELSRNDIKSYPGDKTWVEKKNGWGVNTNSDGNDEREKIRRVPAELTCPDSVILTGEELYAMGSVMEIPCGLMLGSHITVVGKPRWAHPQNDSGIARSGIVQVKDEDENVMVSQFIMELQGLRTVDGEDPPKVLHFNPRLKGDWSGRPVIEQNTYDRMQWGAALRCEGWKSRDDEETVDGQVKCENWIHHDDDNSEESRITSWLKRLILRTTNYPFAEDKLFVLTLSAGMEGYHVNVDGRHVTSFPYRTGFALEDVTGLLLKGDVDVHSIFSASLPTSHPSFAPQRELEMLTMWQAPHLPNGPLELFIGILSSGNHFAERMAVRKSWMQHPSIRSSDIVARFFVAMHGRKEVNVELMKEAEFFGDIMIVPYMDNYDLGALKTVAICKYGVWTMAAKYIMKCDDDTFVRIDAVMKEVEKIPSGRSLYFGNINYHSKPSRNGKWTVTYEEWPKEDYPPYANGDGYILSSDIAHFIVSEFEKHKLRLFKMEDVSVGMWIQQFNSTRPVEYVHSFKFFQFGCVEDYYTAHYQSPTQMTCLWRKLQHGGKAQCCNIR